MSELKRELEGRWRIDNVEMFWEELWQRVNLHRASLRRQNVTRQNFRAPRAHVDEIALHNTQWLTPTSSQAARSSGDRGCIKSRINQELET